MDITLSHRYCDMKSLDAGLALTLISLLVFFVFPVKMIVILATLLLLLCMTIPQVFAPFARIWFFAAELLATTTSRLLLTLVFLLLVTPVGIVRCLLGSDPLKIKAWRSGSKTLFTTRNHRWLPADMEKPY